VHGLLEQKYESAGLEKLLERYCGESTLAQSLTDVLVPAYEVAGRRLFFFDSAAARLDSSLDFPARVAARATSAAPTYFDPPAVMDGESELVFVDGGVYANNPAMCAFAQAQAAGSGSDLLLVSLGTGQQTRPLPSEQVRHWGLAEWARPILHVVLDGASMVIDQQLAMMLGTDRYWRFQTVLTEASDDLDDARPENVALLKRHATTLIDERSADLDRLVEALG
jgi:predicted acylesterase/phospholipase RssA